MKRKIYTVEVKGCTACPECHTVRTEGAGYALDFLCSAANDQLIAGYVEYESESPKDGEFPKFCPLKDVD